MPDDIEAQTRIEIEGHTDNTGTEAYNQGLSERRANAVKAWVVSQGVNPAQITTVGKGESEPVDDNSTKEGRQNNRRVVIRADPLIGRSADDRAGPPRGRPFLCPESGAFAAGNGPFVIFLRPASRPRFRAVCHCLRDRFARPGRRRDLTDAMNTALQAPPRRSGYADCLEAVRARLAAREAKLYGIAVLVVHVHQPRAPVRERGPRRTRRGCSTSSGTGCRRS